MQETLKYLKSRFSLKTEDINIVLNTRNIALANAK
jgi:hypothetical protein